jgi:hypothetical protein
MNYYKIFFLLFLAVQSDMSLSQVPEKCETTIFNSDNSKSDTSKVYIEDKGIGDTTASIIYGRVIDRHTFKSIPNATLVLIKDSDEFLGKSVTDKDGRFTIGLVRSEKGYLKISHPQYKCLRVNAFQFEDFNLIQMKFKLEKVE